jgi:fructose-1,6-bisphosphatase/inositol monophosphatase family enzyme
MNVSYYDNIEKVIWKITRNFVRDFEEIEYLRSNSGSIKNFVEKSKIRTTQILEEEINKIPAMNLAKDYKSIEESSNGVYIIASDLYGERNFQKSIDIFGMYFLCYKKMENTVSLESSIAIFPARKKIYLAQKGKGAWVQKIGDNHEISGKRLRVSSTKETQDAIVNFPASKEFRKFFNFREFGSKLYDIVQVASGRLDAALIETEGSGFEEMIKVFIEESGGNFQKTEKGLVISNSSLAKELDI